MENEKLLSSAPQKSGLPCAANGISWSKRTMDVALSLTGLLLCSPLLCLIAAAICLDDPAGSPFYVSRRVGYAGQTFFMYKFRTMVVGAERQKAALEAKNEMEGPVFKIKEDPRITRLGRFLRRTSLDELPQLLNVLKGDMSLVGPRPPLPDEVEKYTQRQKLRLRGVPGMTGPWQVQPNRYSLSFDAWVDLDLHYLEVQSLWMDIQLLIKTCAMVFLRTGE